MRTDAVYHCDGGDKNCFSDLQSPRPRRRCLELPYPEGVDDFVVPWLDEAVEIHRDLAIELTSHYDGTAPFLKSMTG
jgi:hypothetical protein